MNGRPILVSRCLLGDPVRYDGRPKALHHPLLERWRAEGRVVPVCPEVDGGLPVPRPAAEITGGDGEAVLDGTARIVTEQGKDVTGAFLSGARGALEKARAEGCVAALLKERSPSCGCRLIHDGTFGGGLREGRGVTAALLERNGIRTFCEEDIGALAAFLEDGKEEDA